MPASLVTPGKVFLSLNKTFSMPIASLDLDFSDY